METRDLIRWLLKEGGPVIRYRSMCELEGSRTLSGDEAQLDTLLWTEKTRWLLEQMDLFGPITHVDNRVFNSLHGMKPTCLENVIPRLLERGLRAGITSFDEKMERFRQYVDNPLVHRALEKPESASVEEGRALFIATVMASYFLRGGYEYDEIIQFVMHRMELLSRLAAEKNYDIHMSDAELVRLPKKWAGKPIIRPEMVPSSGTKPLPLIHDLFAFAYLPAVFLKNQNRHQLEDIVAYVTDERYRAFPPGYGYIWPESNRRVCYACGWNLDLPYLGSENPYQQRKIVQYMELLAHFPAARKSPWFQKRMQILETYQTERGTYCFPSPYLVEKKAGYYVGGAYMGLEDNRRNPKTLELESTFRMLLIKKQIA
ncbi:TPA: hypothetical protein HA338_07040 [Methanosarcina acetivorans]|nr:hypothetical protein [Methanosarcina acetivorans]HIH93795.1 hypothetical protein [Methanosarcina acetivorans]